MYGIFMLNELSVSGMKSFLRFQANMGLYVVWARLVLHIFDRILLNREIITITHFQEEIGVVA